MHHNFFAIVLIAIYRIICHNPVMDIDGKSHLFLSDVFIWKVFLRELI